jgi:N-formylglutamate deformylase
MLEITMILHIPHSSDMIPQHLRNQIILSDDDLTTELLRMTDAFTDKLFVYPEATVVRFPISRLLVDVERFPDDTMEPMSKVGMGMIYTRTACGKTLKRTLQPQEMTSLFEYYDKHHKIISNNVGIELERYGKALIVDCHSFPSSPLPCDRDKTIPRPEFCIGTDSFHTPVELIQMTEHCLKKMGFSVGINQPYEGALVPIKFFRKDRHVLSIMIEVNRSLYMDEMTGEKKDSFESIKKHIGTLLSSIDKFQLAQMIRRTPVIKL